MIKIHFLNYSELLNRSRQHHVLTWLLGSARGCTTARPWARHSGIFYRSKRTPLSDNV